MEASGQEHSSREGNGVERFPPKSVSSWAEERGEKQGGVSEANGKSGQEGILGPGDG